MLPLLDGATAVCGPPVTGGVVSGEEAERLARIFRALADPTRVRLVSLIAAHEGGEACVCELTLPVGLRQPTVSHHLKQLVDAGLLTREQRGRWAYYRVVTAALRALAGALEPGRPSDLRRALRPAPPAGAAPPGPPG